MIRTLIAAAAFVAVAGTAQAQTYEQVRNQAFDLCAEAVLLEDGMAGKLATDLGAMQFTRGSDGAYTRVVAGQKLVVFADYDEDYGGECHVELHGLSRDQAVAVSRAYSEARGMDEEVYPLFGSFDPETELSLQLLQPIPGVYALVAAY